MYMLSRWETKAGSSAASSRPGRGPGSRPGGDTPPDFVMVAHSRDAIDRSNRCQANLPQSAPWPERLTEPVRSPALAASPSVEGMLLSFALPKLAITDSGWNLPTWTLMAHRGRASTWVPESSAPSSEQRSAGAAGRSRCRQCQLCAPTVQTEGCFHQQASIHHSGDKFRRRVWRDEQLFGDHAHARRLYAGVCPAIASNA
jgi:hypothetical protein